MSVVQLFPGPRQKRPMPAVANGAKFSHMTLGPATIFVEIFRDGRSLGAVALSKDEALKLAKMITEVASLAR